MANSNRRKNHWILNALAIPVNKHVLTSIYGKLDFTGKI